MNLFSVLQQETDTTPAGLQNFLVAATFEKAITYVFAERLIRNAEARSSTLLCSTTNASFQLLITLRKLDQFLSCDVVVTSLLQIWLARDLEDCGDVQKLKQNQVATIPKT